MNALAHQRQNLDQQKQQPMRLQFKDKDSHELRQDSPAVSDSALCDLLSPMMTPASFTTEYWCRKPLFIKGYPEKLQKLFPGGFERKDFYRVVREAAVKKVKGFQLWARKHQGLLPTVDGQSRPYVFIEPDQMEWMLALGANVAASNISDQRVATFAATLKAQLNHPGEVKVKATLSPQGNGWAPPFNVKAGSVLWSRQNLSRHGPGKLHSFPKTARRPLTLKRLSYRKGYKGSIWTALSKWCGTGRYPLLSDWNCTCD